MIAICMVNLSNEFTQNNWQQVLDNFKPDQVYVLGDKPWYTETMKYAIHVNSTDNLPNISIVAMAPRTGRQIKGEISLVEFQHPKEAVYLFGPDKRHLTKPLLGNRKIDYKVFIPPDNRELYSWMAAAITLYDIRAKN